jgi:uncharacterized protein (TIGR03032 family)
MDAAENVTRVSTSRRFTLWLQQQKCSLMFTTYGTGQLCCVGAQSNGELSFQQTPYGHAQGLWASEQTVWLAVRSVLWRLENALGNGERAGHFDRLYEPRLTYITGDLDIHEVGVAGQQVLFANTRYSCLAAPSRTHNFKPLWKPAFVSGLAPDDRCHLNGMAIADGEPCYVTALGATDTAEGWRANPGGGVLIDVAKNSIVARDLWLPNSPRLHDGKIWLLESGRGQLITIDPQTGAKEDVAFLPGFPRGLAFHRQFAVIGVSLPRENVPSLPLQAALTERGAQNRCGVFILDTRNGALIEWLFVEGQITELFDVAVIPGVAAPMADGPATPGLGSRQTIELS